MSSQKRRHKDPSTPSRNKRARTSMPLSDAHLQLNTLVTKEDRRNRCNELITDIVKSLASEKPKGRVTCRPGHDIRGPLLNLGVTDLANAGEWYTYVRIAYSSSICTN